jgi:hypothetical protein
MGDNGRRSPQRFFTKVPFRPLFCCHRLSHD